MNQRKQSALSKVRSFKHTKTFWYSLYHHRAGKTSLFHIRGVDFIILILALHLLAATNKIQKVLLKCYESIGC